jgi:hypothetical protein
VTRHGIGEGGRGAAAVAWRPLSQHQCCMTEGSRLERQLRAGGQRALCADPQLPVSGELQGRRAFVLQPHVRQWQ